MVKIKTKEQFLSALEHGEFTKVGGYVYFLTSDGEALSFQSAKDNQDDIIHAIENRWDTGWRVEAYGMNWKSHIVCSHSGDTIPSAY